MSHPFTNEEEIRLSPTVIGEQMKRDIKLVNMCCPNCAGHAIENKGDIESCPNFGDDCKSSAQLCECSDCGCKWEVAYSLTLSICILGRRQSNKQWGITRSIRNTHEQEEG